MYLERFFTPRSAEDILAGRVVVTLGGRSFNVPVLKIAAEEPWVELLVERINAIAATVRSEDPARVLMAISSARGPQLELLLAYDQSHVLPTEDWIRQHSDSGELLRAVLGVAATAYPPLAALVELMGEFNETAQMLKLITTVPTSTLPVPGDGTLAGSDESSVPSNSSTTSMPPVDGSSETTGMNGFAQSSQ